MYFVDKGGGGVKNRQKCVYVFYGRPLIYNNILRLLKKDKMVYLVYFEIDLVHFSRNGI